jgi:lipoprotein-anchoring transpeptidase ErfK/SrfK
MTDLYLNPRPTSRRWLWLLFVILLGAAAFLLWKRPSNPGSLPPPSVTPAPGETPAQPTPFPTPVPGSPPVAFDFAPLRSQIDAGELLPARQQLQALLPSLQDPLDRLRAETLLGEVHTRLVFSPAAMPEKTEHIVRSGESLGTIAKRYGTNLELIAAAHNIQRHLIRPGDRLQILQGPFHVSVSKSRNEMIVRHNDAFFKRYVVGTGSDGSTPVGSYVITLRMAQPVWYRPDGIPIAYGHPENLLGTHYLKLNVPGIGLHGTWEPESIGSQSSAGCVRLLNREIEELFLLLPEGTPVEITD